MLIFFNSIAGNEKVRKVFLWLFSIAIVIGFIVFHFKKTNSYIEDMKHMQMIHDEEMKKVSSAYDEERKQHEINLGKLQTELEATKIRYKEATETLDKKKKAATRILIDKYGDDPIGMANRISQVTGFKVVVP